MFVDEARVRVYGGRGGDGAATFHREPYRPKGGPDGGSGGRGGSAVFVADPRAGSLAWLKDHPHQRAASGGNGARNNRTGAVGEDLVLTVPVGTVVSEESGRVVADLARAEDRFVAARGGRGGRGNLALRTAYRRAPRFAELGEPGEERRLSLELRLIADVAVIGYPNAGKSTLVASLSAARPKIADYPFTTLAPSLGVVEMGQERFTICDIPGLIEGAHEGKGLGLEFLRHAMRAHVFLHLIDLASGRDAVSDYRSVRRELESYRGDLADRPEIVALNKCDAVSSRWARETEARFESLGKKAFVVSAQRGDGLEDLKGSLHSTVVEERSRATEEGFELFRSEPATVSVAREEHAWRVGGRSIERWVAMTDMSNPEGVVYLQDRLERAGVEKRLAAAGARPGDEVRIGKTVFEWWPKETLEVHE